MNADRASPSPDRTRRGTPLPARLALFALPSLLTGTVASPLQLPASALMGYDLSEGAGIEVELPRVLEEISGLATTPDGRLFGHDDERAIVYELDPEDGTIRKAFSVGIGGLPGDFEGIAVASERFFLVRSDGHLLEFREGEAGAMSPYRLHLTGLGALCEIEGLAFDPTEHTLLIPCKEPRSSRLQGHVVVFSLPLDSMRPEVVPRVFLPLSELAALGMEPAFHPSAIEVHPETGTLLLVSAQDESMLELTPQGRFLVGRKLIKEEHPQAEGLAVLPDGSLVLADEGRGRRGRLSRYVPIMGKGPGTP